MHKVKQLLRATSVAHSTAVSKAAGLLYTILDSSGMPPEQKTTGKDQIDNTVGMFRGLASEDHLSQQDGDVEKFFSKAGTGGGKEELNRKVRAWLDDNMLRANMWFPYEHAYKINKGLKDLWELFAQTGVELPTEQARDEAVGDIAKMVGVEGVVPGTGGKPDEPDEPDGNVPKPVDTEDGKGISACAIALIVVAVVLAGAGVGVVAMCFCVSSARKDGATSSAEE